MMDACAFTPCCQEDADLFAGQYLREVGRLEVPFAVHLDKCNRETACRFVNHPNCVGITERAGGLFTEKDREEIFRICERSGRRWAWNWDVDETYCCNTVEQLTAVMTRDVDCLLFRYLTMWGKDVVRIDGLSSNRRQKLFNLKRGLAYGFHSSVTNGPTTRKAVVQQDVDDVFCLHWGHMTLELRQRAKRRWDQLYTAEVGYNPYGGWDRILDETGIQLMPLAEVIKK